MLDDTEDQEGGEGQATGDKSATPMVPAADLNALRSLKDKELETQRNEFALERKGFQERELARTATDLAKSAERFGVTKDELLKLSTTAEMQQFCDQAELKHRRDKESEAQSDEYKKGSQEDNNSDAKDDTAKDASQSGKFATGEGSGAKSLHDQGLTPVDLLARGFGKK